MAGFLLFINILLSSFMLYTCRATNVYTDTERSFVIDYEQDSFMKDGKSFRYISGVYIISVCRHPHGKIDSQKLKLLA